jgi:hypothetical protein
MTERRKGDARNCPDILASMIDRAEVLLFSPPSSLFSRSFAFATLSNVRNLGQSQASEDHHHQRHLTTRNVLSVSHEKSRLQSSFGGLASATVSSSARGFLSK